MRIACQADDTYLNGHGGREGSAPDVVYATYAAKRANARDDCELQSNLAKVTCWSPSGDMRHAPADIPGSRRHPDGERKGFKCVGYYKGEDE